MPSVKHGGGCVMVHKFHSLVLEADPNPRQVSPFSQLVFPKLHTLWPPPVSPQLQGECLCPFHSLFLFYCLVFLSTFFAQNRISLTSYNLQHLLAFITDLRLSLNLAPSSIRNDLSASSYLCAAQLSLPYLHGAVLRGAGGPSFSGEVIFTPPTDRVGLLPKSLPSPAVPRRLEGTPDHNYSVAAHALASPRPQPCYPIYLVSFQVRAPFCPFWLAESPPAEPAALSSDGSIPLSFMSLIESVFYVCLLILLVCSAAKRRRLVPIWTESFVLICSVSHSLAGQQPVAA
ncbi:UNVERIFIED_CONTAM: hypothetical protein FKN15_061839 [Acipenser sinensis]